MARAKRRNRFAEDGAEIENEIENGEEMEMDGAEEGVEDMQRAAHETAQDAADMGRRTMRRMQSGALEAYDLFSGPMTRLMEQNWSIFQKMMHVMREESLHFVNRRLEQTNHAIESSKDCGGVSDLLAVQQEWVLNLARDYADQTRRFAELMRDLTEDSASNVAHAGSEVAERGRHAVEQEASHAA